MQRLAETLQRLESIPQLAVTTGEPLSRYTRFAIGGPAAALAEAASEDAFLAALKTLRELSSPHIVIGGGTNLVVSDDGYDGVVLRYTDRRIEREGNLVRARAGADLQELVDFAITASLGGLETMTRIPGSVGAAVYGNAGAYGNSISEYAVHVDFCDGAAIQRLDNEACEFAYRESVFKRRKDWLIVAVEVELVPAEPAELHRVASEIQEIRDSKFPPAMQCAGSVFKNFYYADLPARAASQIPASLVKGGKVPAAWFLEKVGAKGMRRGAVRVADYHANLIYNSGGGTAADLRSLIEELKRQVASRFSVTLEEEVQYIGF